MKTNNLGVEIIKTFEGVRLKAYKCPAGILTIGYGHTGNVKETDTITYEQAQEILYKDLEKFELGVSNLCKVPLNSNQFSALVCFSFNVGLGNLQSSTLLKKLNNKDYLGASQEFLKWNKAGGQVLNGLTARRQKEKELFCAKL